MTDITIQWEKIKQLPISYHRQELAYCLLYCGPYEALRKELMKCVADGPIVRLGPDPIARFLVQESFTAVEEYISYLKMPKEHKNGYLYYLMWSLLKTASLYYRDLRSLWNWCNTLLNTWIAEEFDLLASRMQRLVEIFYHLGRLVKLEPQYQDYIDELYNIITHFLSQCADMIELEAFTLLAGRLLNDYTPKACVIPGSYINGVPFQTILEQYRPVASVALVSNLFLLNWGGEPLLQFVERKLSQLSPTEMDMHEMNHLVQVLYNSLYDHSWRFDLEKIVDILLGWLEHCSECNYQLDWLVKCAQLSSYKHRERILQSVSGLIQQLEKE